MKKSRKITHVIVALLLIGSAISCKKETTDDSLTEADAVELATNAVIPTSGGLALQVSSSLNVYKTTTLSCGVAKDSTITKSSAIGATLAYNYSLKWNYLLTCSGLVPSQLALDFTGSSSYDGLRMSSKDNSTGDFVLTGLPVSTNSYLLAVNYSRTGTQTSKIKRSYSFESTVNIKSTNISIDKSTLQVSSGTATVSITASSTSGKSISFDGTLTFLGGNKATLVLSSGATYKIQW